MTHNVFNFSGGKTSAYMTLKYYKSGDIVIFCDTGREHPKTYEFINRFSNEENIPIFKIKAFESDDPFNELLQKKGNKVLPNRVKRFCTVELKINTAKRFLRKELGIRKFNNFIGFRHDEPLRVKRRVNKYKNVIDRFPLYDDGINKAIINNFWNNYHYTIEIPSILGNCTLCFMKGKNAIIQILRLYPELAEVWIEDEERASKVGINKKIGKLGGRTYFNDITIKELLKISQMPDLFTDIDLNNINPAFDCACTS